MTSPIGIVPPRIPNPIGPISAAIEEILGGGLGYGTPDTDTVTGGATAIGETAKAATDVLGDVTGLGGVVDAVQAVRRWVSDRHNWVRVGYAVGGLWLFGVGAYMTAASPAARLAAPALKVAANVIPAGKAAKVAGAVKGVTA